MAEVLTADSRWLVQPERSCRYVLRAAYTRSTFHMSLGLSPGYRSSTIFWNRDRGCFEISSLLRNFVRCRWKKWRKVIVFTTAYGAAVRRLCDVVTLCRGDLWEDNIKMKLTKHDVSVWAGFKWLTVWSLWRPAAETTLNIPVAQRLYLFVCLFVCLFVRSFVRYFRI